MAVPELVTVRDFTSSRYAQLADNAEGVNLSDVLARAEATIQSRLGRQIKNQAYTEVFRPSTNILFVKNRPITTVTSVRRRLVPWFSWANLDLTKMTIEAEPGYIEPYEAVRGYEVEVVYSAGYTVVPEDIKEAIIMQAVLFSYQDLEIYGAGDAKVPGILYVQKDIENLILPYRATATVYH
jgi:hypothetical protein